jgi:hypothetical protein
MEGDGIVRFHQAKNRFVGGEFTFFLKKIEGQFEKTQFSGYTDSMGIIKAQNAIIKLLSQRGELSRSDIVQALDKDGLSRTMVDRALGNLLLIGKIKKLRYGVYSLSQGYIL